jgi:hypothetical protein
VGKLSGVRNAGKAAPGGAKSSLHHKPIRCLVVGAFGKLGFGEGVFEVVVCFDTDGDAAFVPVGGTGQEQAQ